MINLKASSVIFQCFTILHLPPKEYFVGVEYPKHPNEELNWNIKPKIKQNRDEYKIGFNVVVKELKIIFNKEDFDYHDILSLINPITEPISPLMAIEILSI